MSVSYPNQYRNYCTFDIKEQKNLAQIKASLENPSSEDEVLEDLYTLNLMLDNGEKDVIKLLPSENTEFVGRGGIEHYKMN